MNFSKKNIVALVICCLIITAALGLALTEENTVRAGPLLRLGDREEEVKVLQQRLQDLGLYDGPLTGFYGDQTRYAVERLQQVSNLPPDGIAGQKTLAALEKLEGNLDHYPELKIYTHNAKVFYLQRLLRDLGYLNAEPSGLFRALTHRAVQSFQRNMGLEADGVVGRSTWLALEKNSRLAEPGENITDRSDEKSLRPEKEKPEDSKERISPDTTEIEDDSEEQVFQDTKRVKQQEEKPDSAAMPLLREGDSGEEVRELQRLLQSHGFYSAQIDGQFGYQTMLAVKQFQNLSGLQVDSVVGPNTWRELLAESSGDTIYYTVQPGDSLWTLARRLNTSVNKLRAANNISGDHIRVGDRLRVPGDGIATAEIRDLHWNEVDLLIPEGKIFTITDLETGLSFRVRRLYGNVHADVEPVTRRDTEVKRRIYGGSWSWDRRAVVVHINNMLIAGSINGMPHGGQEITSNNYPGHFCLHFRGSRLHNSGGLDPDHQGMVEEAAEEIWPISGN